MATVTGISRTAESERRRRAVAEFLFDLAEEIMEQGLEMPQGVVVAVKVPDFYPIVKVWGETTDDAITDIRVAVNDVEFKQRFGVDLRQGREEYYRQQEAERREYERTHPIKCKCGWRVKSERGLKMHLERGRNHQ